MQGLWKFNKCTGKLPRVFKLISHDKFTSPLNTYQQCSDVINKRNYEMRRIRGTRLRPKVEQIGPKWIKSRDFFWSESVLFGSPNPAIFQIRFSTFWLVDPKCTESDLKKSPICDRAKMYWIWSKTIPGFVPFGANLPLFGPKSVDPGIVTTSHWDISTTALCVRSTCICLS